MNTDAERRLHKLLTGASARVYLGEKFLLSPGNFYPSYAPAERYFLFRNTSLFFFLASTTLTAFLDRGKIKYRRRRRAFFVAERALTRIFFFFNKRLKFGDRDVFPGISLKLWLGYWNAESPPREGSSAKRELTASPRTVSLACRI